MTGTGYIMKIKYDLPFIERLTLGKQGTLILRLFNAGPLSTTLVRYNILHLIYASYLIDVFFLGKHEKVVVIVKIKIFVTQKWRNIISVPPGDFYQLMTS